MAEVKFSEFPPEGSITSSKVVGLNPSGENAQFDATAFKGDTGDTGDTGAQGDKGDTGDAATATAGTTTTTAPGADADVTNVGTTADAVFNFDIPRGDQGLKGDKGDTGDAGATGDAATADAGSTTTLLPGQPASVTNAGTTADAIFDFGIPQGVKGDKGDQGDAGSGYNLRGAATVNELNMMDAATLVTNDAWQIEGIGGVVQPIGAILPVTVDTGDLVVWSEADYFINYGQQSGVEGPEGPAGDPATATAGTTTTGAPGTNAAVTNVGTTSDAVFNFTIPRGDVGPEGPSTPSTDLGNEITQGADDLLYYAADEFTGPGTSGYVPDPGSAQNYYLRDDGSFSPVPISPTNSAHVNMVFDDVTTESDPGAGNVRVNAIDQSLASEMYASKTTSAANDASVLWDNVVPGSYIGMWEVNGVDEVVYYAVTGAVVDNGTWVSIPISYTSGAGGVDNDKATQVFFIDNPNAKVPGGGLTTQALIKSSDTDYDTEWAYLTGGDVSGPDTSQDNHLAVWNGTNGELLQDSTKDVDDVVVNTGAAVSANFAAFNGGSGKVIQDAGVGSSSFVANSWLSTITSALQPNDDITELNNNAGYKAYYSGATLPVDTSPYDEGDLFMVTA